MSITKNDFDDFDARNAATSLWGALTGFGRNASTASATSAESAALIGTTLPIESASDTLEPSVSVEWKYRAIANVLLDTGLAQQFSCIDDVLKHTNLQWEDAILVAQMLEEMKLGEWSELADAPQRSPWSGEMVVGREQVKAFSTWHLDTHERVRLASSRLIAQLRGHHAHVSWNWLVDLPYAGPLQVFKHPGPLGRTSQMEAQAMKMAAIASIVGYAHQGLKAIPLPSQYRESMTEGHIDDHMSLYAWHHSVRRMWAVVRNRGKDLTSRAAFFGAHAVRLRTEALVRSPDWRPVFILGRPVEPFSTQEQFEGWFLEVRRRAASAIAEELYKMAPRLRYLPAIVMEQVVVRAVSTQGIALDAVPAEQIARPLVDSGALWASLCTNLVFNDLSGILEDFEVAAIFGYGMLVMNNDFDAAMKWTFAWHKVYFDLVQRNLAHSGDDVYTVLRNAAAR